MEKNEIELNKQQNQEQNEKNYYDLLDNEFAQLVQDLIRKRNV